MLKRVELAIVCQHTIELLLLAVFVAVPLLLIPITTELFEFNKMYLVHFAAWIIFICEVIKLFSSNKPTIHLPPLYKAGLIFLGVLTLATVFSIDQHVSWFGYYNRWNGGLWSWVSYAIIFFSITQLTRTKLLWLVKASLLSSAVVAAWGLLEHFGVDANYWVQDVRSRVFSTLGQPNWLAAYLAMIFPWILYYYLHAQARWEKIGLYVLAILNFTVFIFTYSRGGNFGLAAAVVIFAILLGDKLIRTNWKRLAVLTVSCAAVTILFATPLTQILFGSTPHREIGTLEAGDETGNIRLIVWDGALQVFYHHPVLGTGVETFGESFYQFRPLQMNYNAEWNFLFNKAHNEYLNFLATTGALGLLSYLLLLGSFYWRSLKAVLTNHSDKLIFTAAIASTTGYLVQNIFSFTVVPLAILLILNLSLLSLLKPTQLTWTWPKPVTKLLRRIAPLLVLPALIGLVVIANLWRADLAYGTGAGYLDTGETDRSIQILTEATQLNPWEPLYQMQLAEAYAAQAVDNSKVQTATPAITNAVKYSNQALATSPRDLMLLRRQGTIYEQLFQLKLEFGDQVVSIRQKERQLDPTDPSVLVELGHIYLLMNNLEAAKNAYLQAADLKNDYLDPYVNLTNIYLQQGKLTEAKTTFAKAQQIDPTSQDVISLSQKAELR